MTIQETDRERIGAAEVRDQIERDLNFVEARAGKLGVRAATTSELMDHMGCEGEILVMPETIAQAVEAIAKKIFMDEVERRLEEGSDYDPPVFVTLLNGGVKFTTDLAAKLVTFAYDIEGEKKPFILDLDPVYINPSLYGDEMSAGTPELKKGFAADELARISGRHLIIADDGVDKGHTALFVQEHIDDEALVGEVVVPTRGQDGRKVLDAEGVVATEVLQLEKTSSIRLAMLWVKSTEIVDPDYYGMKIEPDWINGYGCNMDIGNGESVGRNVGFIAKSIAQPE